MGSNYVPDKNKDIKGAGWTNENLTTMDANVDSVLTNTNKIDGSAISGLAGVEDSLGYCVNEIEKHLHNEELCFGNSGERMTQDTPAGFTVIGGDDAYGTELIICDGSQIESGSSTKKFDLNTIYVYYVSAANKISIMQFRNGAKGTAITGVVGEADDDVFTKTDHGLADGNAVMLTAITGGGDAVNANTVYYVINKTDNTFKLSTTFGGDAIDIDPDVTDCTVTKITMTQMSSFPISFAATNDDSYPYQIICPRFACNTVISIRAKSESGSNVSINFLVGAHTYLA